MKPSGSRKRGALEVLPGENPRETAGGTLGFSGKVASGGTGGREPALIIVASRKGALARPWYDERRAVRWP